MNEFEIISKYFKPLTKAGGAFELDDDAALLEPPIGKKIIVAKDMLQEGVHFIGDESARNIAHKLLAVNLSDMAAMGASPYAYMLGIGLPKRCGENWIADFARGLQEVQNKYDFHLLGGDSTSTQEHISLSVTMFGLAEKDNLIRRNGAKDGDVIYVSGTIGDAWLGLQLMQGKLAGSEHLSQEQSMYLQKQYQTPTPHIELGELLANIKIITSSMDISDGLLQDISQIAKASNVGVEIDLLSIPISDSAKKLLDNNNIKHIDLLSGGDDYRLLFTVAPENEAALLNRLQSNLKIYRIGSITKKENDMILYDGNIRIPFTKLAMQGWKHNF